MAMGDHAAAILSGLRHRAYPGAGRVVPCGNNEAEEAADRHGSADRVGPTQLERFQAKWRPVRVKKTRQIKNPEPRFEIETDGGSGDDLAPLPGNSHPCALSD